MLLGASSSMEIVADNYQSEPRVSFLQNLDDIGIPYSCSEWSEFCGTESIDIVDDGSVGVNDHFLKNLFALDDYWHNIVIIDHNMVFRHFISCESNLASSSIVLELQDSIEEIIFEMDYILGDQNYDGIIDVLDVVELINVIINEGAYTAHSDIQNDGEVDILDIILIINIILEE